jgi:hypothetical protein
MVSLLWLATMGKDGQRWAKMGKDGLANEVFNGQLSVTL